MFFINTSTPIYQGLLFRFFFSFERGLVTRCERKVLGHVIVWKQKCCFKLEFKSGNTLPKPHPGSRTPRIYLLFHSVPLQVPGKRTTTTRENTEAPGTAPWYHFSLRPYTEWITDPENGDFRASFPSSV